jgi:hypothetical protein
VLDGNVAFTELVAGVTATKEMATFLVGVIPL